jgi:hypothetical protein
MPSSVKGAGLGAKEGRLCILYAWLAGVAYRDRGLGDGRSRLPNGAGVAYYTVLEKSLKDTISGKTAVLKATVLDGPDSSYQIGQDFDVLWPLSSNIDIDVGIRRESYLIQSSTDAEPSLLKEKQHTQNHPDITLLLGWSKRDTTTRVKNAKKMRIASRDETWLRLGARKRIPSPPERRGKGYGEAS